MTREPPASPLRLTVVFRGTVQGVGFRASAMRIAEEFPVRGWIRNEPDGSVRLVAEGGPDEVESFVAAVCGRLDPLIARVDVERSAATGEFASFRIER